MAKRVFVLFLFCRLLQDVEHILQSDFFISIYVSRLIHIHTSSAGTAVIPQSDNSVQKARDSVPKGYPSVFDLRALFIPPFKLEVNSVPNCVVAAGEVERVFLLSQPYRLLRNVDHILQHPNNLLRRKPLSAHTCLLHSWPRLCQKTITKSGPVLGGQVNRKFKTGVKHQDQQPSTSIRE